ncbi:MAG: GNAT family N-acetyltransferase [Candidatus Saccharibacteria bacterium]|nr:GNAT family N-acetyltransferase [Candidatus Saccharibacteria bacterium]
MITEFSKYGVTLRRLTEDKIEMVRNWRNDPKISRFMDFRDFITPEMQKKWFAKIDNENNYYFIVNYKDREIGLTNVRDIDYGNLSGEGGIFIYEDEFLNTDVPYRVIFALNDFCFDELKLEKMVAHIMSDNKRAINFNLLLGYKAENSVQNEDTVKKLTYWLEKNDYFRQRDRFARVLLKR